MDHLKKITFIFMLLQVVIQNVVSDDVPYPAAHINSPDGSGRLSGGIILLDNYGKPDGHITSHKVETKTYTTRLTSGSAGSGIQGWVSGAQSGNLVLQPQVQGIVQSQEGCGIKNNVVTNTGGQSSIVHKQSTVESSQIYNPDGSMKALTANDNQWQTGQKGKRVGSLVAENLNEQTIINGSSQVTNNNLNDISGTIITNNTGNQEINTIQEIGNIQKHQSFFHPYPDSYKVSIESFGDGIYANELTAQQNHNLNHIPSEVSSDSNSQNIIAVPVMRPHLGRYIVHGYRPNIQHYLSQIETNHLIRNPSAILKVPAFIDHIKPDQLNINLSEDQLNSYKQYLIQSGLIKLKPYQLIFSEQFRPNLKTLQWIVVPLESNAEFCRQRCGTLFPRNTLYSTLIEKANKLPLKLLVPVLKIRSGVTKTITGIKSVAGGVSDGPGAFQMKDSSNGPIESLNQN